MHENYAKEAMEDLNSHTNLIVSYAKPGAGEMKMQQRLNNEMLWAMQYAARQRNVGYPVDEFKRLSPRGVQGLEEFRSSPGSVTELSQILQTMQLADAVKRQNAPAAFDIGSSMRSGTNSTSPTLLPTESRRLSAPLLPGSEVGKNWLEFETPQD